MSSVRAATGVSSRSTVRRCPPGFSKANFGHERGAFTGAVFGSIVPEKCDPTPGEISNPTLEDKVRQEILVACQLANWKLGGPRGAAARLGVKRTTLFYKMKRLRDSRRLRTIGKTELRVEAEGSYG